MTDLVIAERGTERRAKQQGSSSGGSCRRRDGGTSPCKCARRTRKRTKCISMCEGKQHAKTK
ncbi:unnamed protein product [Amoebophrya sp. A25]|nr:unnamed protein product [Amoebophrya sp. A25]|eukprot:GSA25T00006588001.1